MHERTYVGWMLVITVITLVAACQAPPRSTPPAPDYAAELGPAVETFMAVWDNAQYDDLDAVVSPDFIRVGPDQSANGLDEMKQFMTQVHTTYPDFSISTDDAWYLDGVAFVRWTVNGTNTGEGAFEPTGRAITVSGLTMLRFQDGKIAEEHAYYDTATVTEQLGLEAVPHAQ